MGLSNGFNFYECFLLQCFLIFVLSLSTSLNKDNLRVYLKILL